MIIDIDASLIHIHSNKQDAAPTYKGGYGFHPLFAFVDHGPGLGGEPLALLMRPGNAGANNADDHIALIRSAYRASPGSDRGGNIGRRILVRTDGVGGTRKVVAYLRSRGFAYSLGIWVNDKIGALVSLPARARETRSLTTRCRRWSYRYRHCVRRQHHRTTVHRQGRRIRHQPH